MSLRKKLRFLIPFPKRRQLKKWFPSFETRNLVFILKKYGIDLVFDVGANTGQYAGKLRSAKYKGEIVSFEPLRNEHQSITKKSAKDNNWVVHKRMAVGSPQTQIKINVFNDSSLSSALSAIKMDNCEVQEVDSDSLDNVTLEYLQNFDGNFFVKLDVQGYEKIVLSHAKSILKSAAGFQIELALLPMYDLEAEYREIFDIMESNGFKPVFFIPVLNRKKYGIIDQIDCVFLRKDLLEL